MGLKSLHVGVFFCGGWGGSVTNNIEHGRYTHFMRNPAFWK